MSLRTPMSPIVIPRQSMRLLSADELHAWLVSVSRRRPVRLREAAQTWQRPPEVLLPLLQQLAGDGRAAVGELGWVAR